VAAANSSGYVAAMTFCVHVSSIYTWWDQESYGHHGAGAGAGHEDLAGITVVLAQGVGDHVGDGVAVTTTVVRKSRLG